LTEHPHQATPGGVVFFVLLKMSGELEDTGRESSDLDFWRATVCVVSSVGVDLGQVGTFASVTCTVEYGREREREGREMVSGNM